ncbi:MAG: 30S ribosomal protein S2 [Candidatus Kerfeldbacteria bacterium]|nr:30S ribosomal protein S2 [Candidatus Kerfeldbacteria bacterium]
MPQIPSLIDMLKAGVHFGHQKAKWHPRMRPFIYTVRHGIHVIDLEQTAKQLEAALNFLREVTSGGGTVLFTSLKEQANDPIRQAAKTTGMPYIVERWLGGVFTNFGVISKLLRRLDMLEAEKQRGLWDKYSKKEQLERQRDFDRLNMTVGGIRNLTRLPQVVFLVGTREGKNAIREAHKVGVPVVALVDTNTNPSSVDYPVPANDDALRAIQMIVGLAAEAVLEGQKIALDQVTTAAVAAVPGTETKVQGLVIGT